MLLETKAGPVQLARDALPHGDHEARAEEDADLAELDFLARLVVPRRAQDHELDALLELLELRAEVERLGILHRELVQAKVPPHLGQLLGARLEEPQPDET